MDNNANNNHPSIVILPLVMILVVYIFTLNKSEEFAKFMSVFNQNIDSIMFIILAMLIGIYYLRMHGIGTEPFCGAEDPSQEDDWCKSLISGKNCTSTSCCVLLNGTKCVGGSSKGPTFLTNNGKNIDFDYFQYKSKHDGSVQCRGKCPK